MAAWSSISEDLIVLRLVTRSTRATIDRYNNQSNRCQRHRLGMKIRAKDLSIVAVLVESGPECLIEYSPSDR